ncbi:MAG TPA: 16S rRNA (cytosine(967)-C(5))-methyltransferase RsmB [Casimicrobiaceae bacterium]|nr:16S rRNA (cytosine(967)-C(5))-methyltransferase RsmB [Casimicrobiaceae bacterium]
MHTEQGLAARAVARVIEGASLADALAEVDDGSELRGRTLVQELAYGTLRHWGTLDALTRRLSRNPIPDALLRSLTAVALYQILHTRAPAFAVVDRAVEAAAQLVRPAAKGLENALLRRFLRERESLLAAVNDDEVARHSFPKWWIDCVRRDFPDDWEAMLDAGNARPPLSLRVNLRATSAPALIARFVEAGIEATQVGDCGVIVARPRPVTELPGYADGAFAVQDLGAQLAAPLLGVADGMRVLDACAAPGGKTTHLLECADIDLTALDADAARLGRVRDNLRRLGHDRRRIRVVEGDVKDPGSWWDGRPYERILLDVPCTASGIVRRHPDIKWRRRAADVHAFAAEQSRMLAAAWPLLAPGGRMLYATCSVFRAENDERVDAFCARQPDALRETINFPDGVTHRGGQILPSASGARHNQDGFFYALLRKNP